MKKEAAHYRKNKIVECDLCPHCCKISEGKTGTCGVRQNEGGTLFSLIYGEVTSIAMDPIEKKPLYHFFPGSEILSIGTKGCNFKCSYCQNWTISQDLHARTRYFSPEKIVETALAEGSVGIAYTYSEPIIWFEYVIDCAQLARQKGLKNVMVTNGYINPQPLEELLEYVDAMNIDLKNFKDESYRKVQKGTLSPVLRSIELAHKKKCHIELTTLIVTGINDNFLEMEQLVNWIAGVDKNIPWHVSRYFPNYRYDAPPTDIDFMLEVCSRAREKLNYVYCGNISGSYGWSNTTCPYCNTTVIRRMGYKT
ncbi:MAG: AmmeMemoRadiSam system radical SAM enzyme, partial [Spirochaetes bacterium]|nr:AmmeMemoRadiSam system radical SAM enzyme [Spirochaetota bacterium]